MPSVAEQTNDAGCGCGTTCKTESKCECGNECSCKSNCECGNECSCGTDCSCDDCGCQTGCQTGCKVQVRSWECLDSPLAIFRESDGKKVVVSLDLIREIQFFRQLEKTDAFPGRLMLHRDSDAPLFTLTGWTPDDFLDALDTIQKKPESLWSRMFGYLKRFWNLPVFGEDIYDALDEGEKED